MENTCPFGPYVDGQAGGYESIGSLLIALSTLLCPWPENMGPWGHSLSHTHLKKSFSHSSLSILSLSHNFHPITAVVIRKGDLEH